MLQLVPKNRKKHFSLGTRCFRQASIELASNEAVGFRPGKTCLYVALLGEHSPLHGKTKLLPSIKGAANLNTSPVLSDEDQMDVH
jgi:hypothetical protein